MSRNSWGLIGEAPRRLAFALISLTSDTDDDFTFVDSLIERLAGWVGTLPASQWNHHSKQFGLLRHSTEVGRLAAENLERHRGVLDAFPGVEAHHRGAWARALVVAALYHDVGKIYDVRVRRSSQETWDPERESFAEFAYHDEFHRPDSFGLFFPDLGRLTHVAGRGLSHEVRTRELMPTILRGHVPDPVLVRALAIYDAYTQRHDLGYAETLWPLPFLGSILAAADQCSSYQGYRPPAPKAPLLVPDPA